MGQNGIGASDDGSCYTLNTMDVPAVVSGFKFHKGSGAGSIGYEREQSPTLTADWHNPAVLVGGDGQCEATQSACGGGDPAAGRDR